MFNFDWEMIFKAAFAITVISVGPVALFVGGMWLLAKNTAGC